MPLEVAWHCDEEILRTTAGIVSHLKRTPTAGTPGLIQPYPKALTREGMLSLADKNGQEPGSVMNQEPLCEDQALGPNSFLSHPKLQPLPRVSSLVETPVARRSSTKDMTILPVLLKSWRQVNTVGVPHKPIHRTSRRAAGHRKASSHNKGPSTRAGCFPFASPLRHLMLVYSWAL